jgi:hypothetical protein
MMLNVPRKRTFGLEVLPARDKENDPPSFALEPTKKQRKVNKIPFLNGKGLSTTKALKEAMDVVECETTSLQKASKHWASKHSYYFII